MVYFLIICWLSFTLFVLMSLRYSGAFSLLNPLLALTILFAFSIVGKLLFLKYTSNQYFIDFNLLENNFSILYDGVIFSAIFISSILLSFIVFFPKIKTKSHLRELEYKGSDITGLIIVLSILLISTVSLGIFYQSTNMLSGKRFVGEYVTSSDRFSNMNYLYFKLAYLSKITYYISITFSIINTGRYRKTWITIAIVSFFILLLSSTMFSNRAMLLIVLIDTLLLYSVLAGRLNIKLLFTVFTVFIILFLGISELRLESSSAETQKTFIEHIFGGRYLADIAKTSVLLNYLTHMDNSIFLNFNSLSELMTSYINLGKQVGAKIFDNPGSGVPLGIISELYILNGTAWIIAGGALIGLLYKLIFVKLTSYRINLLLLLLCIFIYSRSIIFLTNNGLGVTVYQILIDLIPLSIFSILVSFNTKKTYKIN